MRKLLLIYICIFSFCFYSYANENNKIENDYIEELRESAKNLDDPGYVRKQFSDFFEKFPQTSQRESILAIYQKHLDGLKQKLADSKEELKEANKEILEILKKGDFHVDEDEFQDIARIRSALMIKHAPIGATFLLSFNDKIESIVALNVICYSNEPVLFDEVLIKISDYLYEKDIDSENVQIEKFKHSDNENDKYISSTVIFIEEKEEEMIKKLIASKSARIRFASKKRNVDTDIRDLDILNVKRVLELKITIDDAKKQSQ